MNSQSPTQPKAHSFIQRWVIDTLAVLVATSVVDGIRYDNVASLLTASLLLGILNAFLKPIMLLLSLPLLIFTLGLFTFVINAGLLYLVGYMMQGFDVRDFATALKGALVIGVISFVVNLMLGKRSFQVRSQVQSSRGNKPPPPGNGPVIDV